MFQYISVICMSVSMPARKIQDGKKGKRNDILWTSMDDIFWGRKSSNAVHLLVDAFRKCLGSRAKAPRDTKEPKALFRRKWLPASCMELLHERTVEIVLRETHHLSQTNYMAMPHLECIVSWNASDHKVWVCVPQAGVASWPTRPFCTGPKHRYQETSLQLTQDHWPSFDLVDIFDIEWYMMAHDHALVKALTAALGHTLAYPADCFTSQVLTQSEMSWDILNGTVFSEKKHLYVHVAQFFHFHPIAAVGFRTSSRKSNSNTKPREHGFRSRFLGPRSVQT